MLAVYRQEGPKRLAAVLVIISRHLFLEICVSCREAEQPRSGRPRFDLVSLYEVRLTVSECFDLLVCR